MGEPPQPERRSDPALRRLVDRIISEELARRGLSAETSPLIRRARFAGSSHQRRWMHPRQRDGRISSCSDRPR